MKKKAASRKMISPESHQVIMIMNMFVPFTLNLQKIFILK